ncbi:hypothetical protein EJ05DRAFT_383029 [Pseudovirgaria hyperparasitica]|uniref:Grh/CP2 DB domain-containing protein n=1 Tax=Pseudovirgaria hyperparasitica TaxID=470096 RepID=A0A6A6W8C2_9PEZI|nr:uncharacterized protein EJ05DRAFT_383029 [Pseudovirgaria hyperparasitica]KAF2758274.1 hypothetical protein EJ05DRAFT_383029 [Pseudovirgaria hyperparasitica]
MFSNRTTRKPNEQLLADFKSNYGGSLAAASRHSNPTQPTAGTSLTDALDVAVHFHNRHPDDLDDFKDSDPTPKAGDWATQTPGPSFLDPTSAAFHDLEHQRSVIFTPTPGGTTRHHMIAGDLSMPTPGGNFNYMQFHTPSSMSSGSDPTLQLQGPQVTTHNMHDFAHPTAFASHMFHDPFHAEIGTIQHSAMQHGMPPQQTFAPHEFYHHPTAYEQIPQTIEESPLESMHGDIDMSEHSPVMTFHPPQFGVQVQQNRPESLIQQFRWRVSLNAPTAMIKSADEIPITYLNKGQAYSVRIKDSTPGQASSVPNRYRTFIRVSYEDEQQRQRPGSCWQLWKEGRGTSEAHQRGGRLQAVEFVESTQAGGAEITGRPSIELESSSFDGFCVNWTAVPNQNPECSVAVRFNFLSTDFSHSKGVKGIPVRLCAKTELLSSQQPQADTGEFANQELAFCKVKLFRDHGAERKLTNDTSHTRKQIEKLLQQIQQMEAGIKDPGKRRRSGTVVKPPVSQKPGKVPKHRRTWSATDGASGSAEEDLRAKLKGFQDMESSTFPETLFYLKGEELDDPDLHPVQLPGMLQDIAKAEMTDAANWDKQSVAENSSVVSPSPSSMSLNSSGERRETSLHQAVPFSRVSSNEWRNLPGQTATGDMVPGVKQHLSPPSLPLKLPKSDSHQDMIEAVDVDPDYQPPPERAIKPVACFFVRPTIAGDRSEDDYYYRAVYLMQHTLMDLVRGIAGKLNIEPTLVVETIRIHPDKGFKIYLDDEAVREIPEGQDMLAEFHPTGDQAPVKREWEAGASDVQVDGDVTTTKNVTTSGYALHLRY